MALITATHTHQSSKPPQVTRDGDTVTIRWGELRISMPAAEAHDLARALTADTP